MKSKSTVLRIINQLQLEMFAILFYQAHVHVCMTVNIFIFYKGCPGGGGKGAIAPPEAKEIQENRTKGRFSFKVRF